MKNFFIVTFLLSLNALAETKSVSKTLNLYPGARMASYTNPAWLESVAEEACKPGEADSLSNVRIYIDAKFKRKSGNGDSYYVAQNYPGVFLEADVTCK